MAAPMIVAGAGVARLGEINRSYLTVMDLAPTFLDLAEAQYPSDGSVWPMLGESMLPLLSGSVTSVHANDYVTTLYHGGRAFIRQGKWKLVTMDPPFSESEFELYNLEVDPGEATNLAELEPERFAMMVDLWREKRRELGIILPGDS